YAESIQELTYADKDGWLQSSGGIGSERGITNDGWGNITERTSTMYYTVVAGVAKVYRTATENLSKFISGATSLAVSDTYTAFAPNGAVTGQYSVGLTENND